ncbi:MAG: amino acid ABC transporter substrate-binding protein [Spirochaetes bacterium]|nr:amino acid ABC transporter substrate-binding protein [Spirochaetota bacterium]
MNSKFLKILSVLTVTVVILAGCGREQSKDDSLKKIRGKGYFIVGLDDTFPPMGFRSEDNNEIVGFDVDLAKEAARRMGINVQFKPVVWDGVIMSLDRGDIDVIWNGLTITEEREKKINFSRPYLNNRQIIMVRFESPVNKLSDLKGKVIGLQRGSSSEKALGSNDSFAKSIKEVKKYENNNLALMDLAAKRVDAVVIDEIVGRWSMAMKPGKYKIIDDDLGKELYGVGIRKTDITFKEELDRVLEKIKNDSTGEEISKKWFGTNILLK